MKKYGALTSYGAIGVTLLITGSLVAVGQTQTYRKSFAAAAANRTLPEQDEVVKTDLSACEARPAISPQSSVRVFPKERVQRNLTGIWRGRVYGKYDKKLLAKDGYLNVDYYMIIDTNRSEGLVFEQFSDQRAIPRPVSGTPTWSYLMCGSEKYQPSHPAQVHEFQKVSGNIEDARTLLKTSTGMNFDSKTLVLSEVWQKLVDAKYFDTSRSLAYAGALFKPFDLKSIPDQERGTSLMSMRSTAEYRGGGMTAAKFESGVALKGVEEGAFLGVSTDSGDYLVASAGNGMAMAKDASAQISMTFDKVVIGPLTQ